MQNAFLYEIIFIVQKTKNLTKKKIMPSKTRTIDVTPTWTALVRPMMEVLKNPKASSDSVKGIEAEFIRMAKIIDESNEKAKNNS